MTFTSNTNTQRANTGIPAPAKGRRKMLGAVVSYEPLVDGAQSPALTNYTAEDTRFPRTAFSLLCRFAYRQTKHALTSGKRISHDQVHMRGRLTIADVSQFAGRGAESSTYQVLR
ncbi:hypothetical protein CIB48_g5259 [Xylaria polymorpha]|nr:hypothetical protein CIB48_g5259 [Xylaria polymorpha]